MRQKGYAEPAQGYADYFPGPVCVPESAYDGQRDHRACLLYTSQAAGANPQRTQEATEKEKSL